MLDKAAVTRPVTSRTMHRLCRARGGQDDVRDDPVWEAFRSRRLGEDFRAVCEGREDDDNDYPRDGSGIVVTEAPLEAHDTLALDEQSMADLPLVQRTLDSFFAAPDTIRRRCCSDDIQRLNCDVEYVPDERELYNEECNEENTYYQYNDESDGIMRVDLSRTGALDLPHPRRGRRVCTDIPVQYNMF